MKGIAVGHFSGYIRNDIKLIICENEGKYIHVILSISFDGYT